VGAKRRGMAHGERSRPPKRRKTHRPGVVPHQASSAVRLNVNPLAPAITAQPAAAIVIEGEAAVCGVAASGRRLGAAQASALAVDLPRAVLLPRRDKRAVPTFLANANVGEMGLQRPMRPPAASTIMIVRSHFVREPTMKLNGPVVAIAMVVALTIVSAVFRVSTAPERIRLRLESAKASCIDAGGQWVEVGREQSCQPVVERTKS
jgi:hypothetical protein